MKLKILGLTGLIFLIINQVMLLGGEVFIQTQKPIDYAHWFLLIGVLLTASLNHIFSDSNFGTIATTLTSLGVIALVGQATIDFLWWSYGTDYEGMNQLIDQIMSKPSIRIPFITIGPALFYLGLAMQAGKFIRTHPIWVIMTFAGVMCTGLGSFVYDSRMGIILGHIILSIGLVVLMHKKPKTHILEETEHN